MKILVISNYRETVSVRPEAELFIGLKKLGVDVEIMTYGDAEYCKKFKAAGIRVIDFHPEKKLDKKEINRIKTELINGQHDILHLFNSKAIINGIQAAKKLPVKIVLYRGYTGNINWFDPTAYFKYLHPKVDKIWCIARSIEEHIRRQKLFKKNVPTTINKGHDLNWYNNINSINRNGLENIPADEFWVINVANNRTMKGISYLLNSMNHIPKELPINLLLVGNKLGNKKNIELINYFPNKNKIYFLGYRTDVLNIVKASDAFILSSIKGEATTKAVIEAMALGVPPIITDIPGNKNLVVNNESGLIVSTKNPKAIADAILKLYHDKKLRIMLGNGAKNRIEEKFNIKTTIVEIKLMYEKLIAN